MKSGIFAGLILTAVLVALFAACQSATNVSTNSSSANGAMNRNSMTMANANSMSNMQMSNSNMSGMSGDMMMKSDPNAASQPYDLQFIDTMSMHHKSATDMAEMALTSSQNPELKAFAQKIIDDQKKEIAQMKDWREKWFAGKPAALNMELPGMDSAKSMNMSEMQVAKGKEFDLMFLDAMTKHHTSAIQMAKDALTKAEKPEIKTMANDIIKAQEAEIKQMADWKAEWSK